jgi:hypothetical protein
MMSRRSLTILVLALALGLITAGNAAAARHRTRRQALPHPVWSLDARHGIQEMLGGTDHSTVAWNAQAGLWGVDTPPTWWQSALAVTTIVRYATLTNNLSPAIQNVLLRTYEVNRKAQLGNFTNAYMDDTGWWGLAWVMASQYELYHRHDRKDARRFLATAEQDASFIAHYPRQCGGIKWTSWSPPDTIANAEFVDLAARLARYRQASGIFQNRGVASRWLTRASADLAWMVRIGLINLNTGTVLGNLDADCQPQGGPLPVTEGEAADALVQLGGATHNHWYYGRAAAFLHYTTSSASPLMAKGILQDQCELAAPNCAASPDQLNVTSRKGIFMLAVDDWDAATGGAAFRPFLQAQVRAIVRHDILRTSPPLPACVTPHACRFGFSWTGDVHSMLVTPGTQESALDAFIAALR